MPAVGCNSGETRDCCYGEPHSSRIWGQDSGPKAPLQHHQLFEGNQRPRHSDPGHSYQQADLAGWILRCKLGQCQEEWFADWCFGWVDNHGSLGETGQTGHPGLGVITVSERVQVDFSRWSFSWRWGGRQKFLREPFPVGVALFGAGPQSWQ